MAATPEDGNGGERKKMITLISSEGESFETTEVAAAMSTTIANMIEDGCVDETGVRLPNVASGVLAKVLEYCSKHADDLEKFDKHAMLFDIILAANFLDIKGLMDLSCQTVADMLKGKSPEEIRRTFFVTNDYTPEEEAEIRKKNAWAFD